MKFMQEISPKDPHIDDINIAINKLEKVINNKKTIGVKNQYIQQIIIDISKLLNLYKEACKTPYWIPSFK